MEVCISDGDKNVFFSVSSDPHQFSHAIVPACGSEGGGESAAKSIPAGSSSSPGAASEPRLSFIAALFADKLSESQRTPACRRRCSPPDRSLYWTPLLFSGRRSSDMDALIKRSGSGPGGGGGRRGGDYFLFQSAAAVAPARLPHRGGECVLVMDESR